MYRFLIVILMLSIAGVVFAADVNLSNRAPEVIKDSHGGGVILPTVREGGETIATALPIPGLPYTDTGNTCDNAHDYDETCPYSGSYAPDVVYSYAPAADGSIDIDLCFSSYDTKVFVYENVFTPGSPYACNDDYHGPPCGLYTSFIEAMAVTGGNTYFIVVDGFGSGCGDYTLDVVGNEPCVLECPDGALDEGEPPVYDGYVDNFNGGCHSDPNVFSYLTVEVGGCTTVCGSGGFYDSYRDTDWYEVIAPTDVLGIKVVSENLFDVILIYGNCPDPGAWDAFSSDECGEEGTEYTFSVVAGQRYWVFVGINWGAAANGEYDYVLSVCGYDVVGTENTTWGGVKSLFR